MKCVLFVLMLLFSFAAMSAEENKAYGLGNGLIVSGFINNEYQNVILAPGQGNVNPVIDALSRYYDFAIKNNTNMIANLHYIEDGSKLRAEAELNKNPAKYSGFKSLEEIRLGRIISWEKYKAVEVKWLSKSGESVGWIELLYCSDICYISDKLVHQDNDFSLFSSFISLTKDRNDYTKIGASKNICIAAKSACEKPIQVQISVHDISKEAYILKGKKYAGKSYSNIASAYQKVWSVDDDEMGKIKGYSEIESVSFKSLDCCVKNIRKREIYPSYDKERDGLRLVHLTPGSIFQFFRRTEKVEFIYSLKYQDVEYVYSKLTLKNGIPQLHLFLLDEKSRKMVSQPENFLVANIIMHPQVFLKTIEG